VVFHTLGYSVKVIELLDSAEIVDRMIQMATQEAQTRTWDVFGKSEVAAKYDLFVRSVLMKVVRRNGGSK
jgi:hypothetical protein